MQGLGHVPEVLALVGGRAGMGIGNSSLRGEGCVHCGASAQSLHSLCQSARAASSDGVRFGGLAKGWAHVLALQCLGAALGPQSTLALLKGLPLLGIGSACLIPSFSWKCKFTCEVSSFVIELIPVFFIEDYRISPSAQPGATSL